MRVIHYGQDELITGDDIAEALVRYAQFLAVASLAATIDVPILDSTGRVVTASILLGPASQIVALPFETDSPELVDEAVVADLTAQADRIGPSKADPVASPEDAANASFVDDL